MINIFRKKAALSTNAQMGLTIWQKKYASKKSGDVLTLNLENLSK